MRKVFHVFTIIASLWLAAGAQGQTKVYLVRPMPGEWHYDIASPQTLPTDDDWWRRFGDARLDSLIAIGMENNFNLAIAAKRREIARLAVRQAQSAYYPTVGVGASYTRSRAAGVNANNFALSADASWEIDLFGRITSQVKAQKEAYNASRADYAAAMVSLAADIATYYIEMRVTAMQLRVADEHLQSQQHVMDITQARFDAGLVSKLDVTQAQVVLLNTEATLPALRNTHAQYYNALATLLGVYPEQLAEMLPGTGWALPDYDHLIPAGVPADLLRRRPDIAEAEYNIASYAAKVGIAKKDFLPTLTLNGSIGVSSNEIDNLFKSNSFGYSVGPKLSWTVFDGLSRKYALSSAKEQMQSAIESYNLTVMSAVEEVNDAMSAYQAALRTMEIQTQIVEQTHEAFELSMDQYKQGLSSFTNVVDAQIDWLSAANSLVAANGNVLTSLVNIYKALGGSPIQ